MRFEGGRVTFIVYICDAVEDAFKAAAKGRLNANDNVIHSGLFWAVRLKITRFSNQWRLCS